MHKVALYGVGTPAGKRVPGIYRPKRAKKCTMDVVKQGLMLQESTRGALVWILGPAPEITAINGE